MARLTLSRVIAASLQEVFEALTEPAELRKWWGPPDVECSDARVEARVGGNYRIENRLPDGSVVVISGRFIEFEPPRRLRYSWNVSPGQVEHDEVVTIELSEVEDGTNVKLTHERIAHEKTRQSHLHGWSGCLDGLSNHFS